MKKRTKNVALAQGELSMNGDGDIFESNPRFGNTRDFPGFKERGKNNLKYQ